MSPVALLVVLAPLPLALALLNGSLRASAIRATPLAPLPALVVAIWGVSGTLEIDWLLLGTNFALEGISRAFLLLAAVVWAVAAAYYRAYPARDVPETRFTAFFLLAMTGSLGVAVAGDVVSFYAFFSLMTFAGYALVRTRRDSPPRPGLIYIGYAVLGETLLLAGILLAVSQAGGDIAAADLRAAVADAAASELIALLLIAGFAVKAAAAPLHSWAPPAYSAAPPAGAAVLSGAMAKAGLLGWLTFLPLGEAQLPVVGTGCLVFGLLAAYGAVAVGLCQRVPRAALAYSSISQMGLMLSGVGAALVEPAAWPLAGFVLAFFALQHALAKAGLFLGEGLASAASPGRIPKPLFWAAFVLPALALAGAPATSGYYAKVELQAVVVQAGGAGEAASALVAWSAVGTTALLGWVILLARGRSGDRAGPWAWVSWALLLAAVASLPWSAPALLPLGPLEPYTPSPSTLVSATVPVLLGAAVLVAIAATGMRLPDLGSRLGVVRFEKGIALLTDATRRLDPTFDATEARGRSMLSRCWRSGVVEPVESLDQATARWSIAGIGLVGLVGLLFVLVVMT
jgi:hydrogenase-4 component B